MEYTGSSVYVMGLGYESRILFAEHSECLTDLDVSLMTFYKYDLHEQLEIRIASN